MSLQVASVSCVGQLSAPADALRHCRVASLYSRPCFVASIQWPTQTQLPRTFQELIFALQTYWSEQGCIVLQPYDMEMGAGTFHSATFLRAVGPEPWSAAYVQPSRRPTDGRYGNNPFRLQHYYQFQVCIKPSPDDFQELYLGSLRDLGFDLLTHDIRFVEDNWESPTLGAWGLGLGGVAQRHGGLAVHLLPAGRRPGLPAGDGRDHLRARAPGDVHPRQGKHLRHRLDRRAVRHGHLRRCVPSERSGAIDLQLREGRHGGAVGAIRCA